MAERTFDNTKILVDDILDGMTLDDLVDHVREDLLEQWCDPKTTPDEFWQDEWKNRFGDEE